MASNKHIDGNDSHIIYLINENSEDAKEYLYNKYKLLIKKEINRVKKYAYKYNIDLSDLTQEANLAFLGAINSYNDEEDAKFITFATICIRRKLSSYIEKYKTNKIKVLLNTIAIDAFDDNTNFSILSKFEDTRKEPLKNIIVNESLNETYKKFKTLNDNEQLALKYSLEDKSAKEIAKIMNISTKQVYNYIYRARNKLKW